MPSFSSCASISSGLCKGPLSTPGQWIFVCQIGAPKWIGEALSRSRCVDLTASRLVPENAVLIALLGQYEASTSRTFYIGGAELVDTLFDMLSEIFDLFVAHPHVAGTPAASATLRAFKA
jgi:hypothetical protein